MHRQIKQPQKHHRQSEGKGITTQCPRTQQSLATFLMFPKGHNKFTHVE